ncbi:MAG: HD domain-containing protein [Candidatus Zixiibacteriota bacterium]|nr:MAG: HD domain-containing protein [candidate division Zixibacteria bacterium]
MENKLIKDLVVDDRITSFFAVRKKNVREYTKGQFLSLELGDATGRISAVHWEPDQFCLTELAEGMVVKVRGVVGEYNNKKQIVINLIRLAKDDEYPLEQILPHSDQPIEQRKARIMALAEKIENGYIRKLVEAFFGDEKFLNDYLTAAAGKLWHHAYIGGLSEHSANVAELALRAGAGYDFLDKDYLIFGGLFHDAGKIGQYSTGTVIDYTDEGRLVGHICLVDDWICRRAATIEAFPEKLLMKLRHIILSHQGELEYATPIVPQMPEAFVVYYCDEIDSKMGAIERIRERHGGKGWSDYVSLINRYLYFGEDKDTRE